MKNLIILTTLLFTLALAAPDATAQQQQQQRTFGIGAILNSPTGISMKGYINERIAVDGAIAFQVSEFNSSFYLHSNVLFHERPAEGLEAGDLQFYYGAGLRLLWNDIQNDIQAGIRGPVGTSYYLEDQPMEVFFELAPTIDFHPSFRFGFAGGLGMRYYLN